MDWIVFQVSYVTHGPLVLSFVKVSQIWRHQVAAKIKNIFLIQILIPMSILRHIFIAKIVG